MNARAQEKIDQLRTLSSPSDPQRLILLLADMEPRSAADERTLAALLKAEWAADRARSARAAAARILAKDAERDRKARTRRLIELGGLVDIAGLADMDKGTLLGALLAIAGAPPESEKAARWKQHGDAEIAKRDAARKR